MPSIHHSRDNLFIVDTFDGCTNPIEVYAVDILTFLIYPYMSIRVMLQPD